MGMLQLPIYDASTTSRGLGELVLTLDLEINVLRAESLIRRRVEIEVARYNRRKGNERFRGLVTPTQEEAQLNGYGEAAPRRVLDLEQQIRTALAGFQSNRYFLIVDDEQVETLDAWLTLTEKSTVQFFRLMPLVGG